MLRRIITIIAGTACLALWVIGALTAPSAVVGWVVLAAFIGGMVALAVPDAPTEPVGWTPSSRARRAGLVGGLTVFAACGAVTGLVLLLGVPGAVIAPAVLVVVSVAGIRPFLSYRRNRSTDVPEDTALLAPADPESGSASAPRPVESPLTFEALSLDELCLAWRLSAAEDRSHMTCWEAMIMREQLLDEFERRDPDGFVRWMWTGAEFRDPPRTHRDPEG